MTSQVWYRDSIMDNAHEPHVTDPPQYLTLQELWEKTAVRVTKVPNCEDEAEQAKIRQEGGYNYFDWLNVSREALGSTFEDRVKRFNNEHLHEDDEIRLITAGSAYFEMRDFQDRWIRLHVKKGDLMHLPAGLYHRLALDSGETVQMLRLYKDSPQWQALNRPEGDKCTARQHYLKAAPSSEL